jgi:ABC-type branched-subunit amino acid transport system permease subunit
VAVRDNESAAAAMGITVVRTKLLAFAVSGFIAGYAGVCIAFASERLSDTGATGVFTSAGTFDPALSWLILSMVVIGGLGSISGAVLGAIYLVGLPAIFGTTSSIQLLTSGIGLIAFILYLPGGLAEVMHRIGDAVASGVDELLARWHPPPSAGDADTPVSVDATVRDPMPAPLTGEVV